MKKIYNNKIFSLMMAILLIFSVVAMPIRALAVEESVIPRAITIDSNSYSGKSGSFYAYFSNHDGYVPAKLYVLGNKTGGGANTTITISGTGIPGGSKKVSLNGSTQVINLSGMTANVTDWHNACTIGDNGTYNISMWITN